MPQLPLSSDSGKVVVARPVPVLPYGRVDTRAPKLLTLPGVRHRDAGLDLGLILLAAVIVPFVPSLAALLLDDGASFPTVSLLTVFFKWIDALLVGGLAAYLLLRHRLPFASFGLRSDRLGVQVLFGAGTLAAAYAYLMFSALVILSIMLLIPDLQKDLEHRLEFLGKLQPATGLLRSVLLFVPVAIHEELLFRGLLLPYLRRLMGSWWLAILASSVLFGVLHFSQGWIGVLQITGVAAVLGTCFVLSRSLLAVIIAHFVFDFGQLQLVRVLQGMPDLKDLLPGG